MSVPGKLRPSPYEMTPIVTDRLVATEYNRWPGGTHGLDERTVERTKESRAEQLAALNAPVNRSSEGVGTDATKLQAYAHFRSPGDIYSDTVPRPRGAEPPAGKTTLPSKVGLGALPNAPAAKGFGSTYYYRQ